MVALLQVPQGSQRALRRLTKQSPIICRFRLSCVFGQPGKEK